MARRIGLLGSLLILGVVAFSGRSVAQVAQDAGKGPQYRFKAGETYVYAVTVVGEIGQTTESTKGTIELTVKSADSNQMQLTPQVRLATQLNPPASGKKLGPRRPLGFVGKTKVAALRELVIDPHGKFLKFSGETSLPLLLGTAEELVIEPLSAKGEKRWQHERDLVIVDSKDAKTPAKEVVTYEITGAAGATLKIKKSYDLKTAAQAGEAPRLHMEGTTDMVFDTEAGLIKSGEFKGEIVIVDKDEMRHIPLTASYRLLTAAEAAAAKKEAEAARLKALEAAKAAAALKPISDADITQAIAELKAGGVKVQFAADRLARSIPVDDRRDEVVTELLTILKERDDVVRAAAAKALKTWGTSKNVPTFIDLLKDNSIFARHAALEALGQLKDAKGAEAVAQQLLDNRMRMQAAASLKAMGSVAEKAVLPLLKEKEWSVRLEACKVLGAIGTNDSVAALKAARDDSNRLVASEAEKAIKEIEGR